MSERECKCVIGGFIVMDERLNGDWWRVGEHERRARRICEICYCEPQLMTRARSKQIVK